MPIVYAELQPPHACSDGRWVHNYEPVDDHSHVVACTDCDQTAMYHNLKE